MGYNLDRVDTEGTLRSRTRNTPRGMPVYGLFPKSDPRMGGSVRVKAFSQRNLHHPPRHGSSVNICISNQTVEPYVVFLIAIFGAG